MKKGSKFLLFAAIGAIVAGIVMAIKKRWK